MAKSKKGMAVPKPPVEKVPDYHGAKNPYIKTSPERKIKDEKGTNKIAVNKPKVEEVPDFHGTPNPVPKATKPAKVVEVTSFKEYMDAKGKLQEPKITLNVTNFPKAATPPTPSRKVSDTGSPLPYVATSKPKVSDKAFGDQGSIPAYIPKTDKGSEEETLKKTKNGQPQVESVVKKMSLVEMTRYLAQQTRLLTEEDTEVVGAIDDSIPKVTAWASGKIMPDPIETVEYITHLASMNSNLMEMLVRTLKKKQGGMGGLVSKLLDQPETFKELVGHFEGEHGPQHASSMCRAMADAYNNFKEQYSESALSPPIGFSDEEQPEDDEMGFDPDEEEQGDEEEQDGDEGLEPTSDEEPPAEMPKKKRKSFSHDHLINAMSEHKPMLDSMTAQCKKCGTL